MSRRRTRRLALTVPVEVSGKDVGNTAFTIAATATNLNRHGATLQIDRDLAVGSIVVMQNNRRARVSARVVAQISTKARCSAYGVEFIDADNVMDFWGITFPSPANGRR
jgi:hypothetical protein